MYTYGGIVGLAIYGSCIDSCYNSSNILDERMNYSGGIVGAITDTSSQLIVSNCYNIGNISGKIAGGIVAELANYGGGNASPVYVRNSYNIGTVTGSEKTGEVVGYVSTNGYVENCYYGNTKIENQDKNNLNTISISKITSTLLNKDKFKEDTNGINNGYPILNWQ